MDENVQELEKLREVSAELGEKEKKTKDLEQELEKLEKIIVETDFEGGKYEIPGGRKEEGESDEVALLREVLEEVGLVVRVVRLLDEWRLDLPDKDVVLNGKTYLCEYV